MRSIFQTSFLSADMLSMVEAIGGTGTVSAYLAKNDIRGIALSQREIDAAGSAGGHTEIGCSSEQSRAATICFGFLVVSSSVTVNTTL